MKKLGVKAAARRNLAPPEARRLIAQLNQRLEERTLELQAARAENESLTYSVSHDLRAPLVHIGGFVDLLFNHLSGTLDEQGRHYLQTITASTLRMGRMIDEVLDYARLNQVELQKVSFDLEALAHEVIGEMRLLAEKRHVIWLVGHLPVIEADPTLIRQVLVHLASNAIKFTALREDARIQLSSRREPGQIVFLIRDNGVGFDMKYRDKLFGLFQRLHAATDFDGNGVGLAHVARIIQRHGGRTWAEGVPGGGATFYFSLPDRTSGPP